MKPYSRPYHKSTRLRHFAAGVGGVVLLFTLLAASRVGIAPMEPGEPREIVVDVVDVPCDEPFDRDVEVLPDTLGGDARLHVVVRKRDCCCCLGGDADFGVLREGGARRLDGRPRPERPPVVREDVRRDTVRVGSVVPPARPLPPSSAQPTPMAGVFGPVAAPVPSASRAGIPWWIALGAGALYFLRGREDRPPGGVCEDDEVGRNSGPPRTGCWPRVQAPFSLAHRSL
ncbi:hypothetical protein [Rubrivirga sp.]|uniref:hypothetical protein n=1 Tax=Rubrivirga sp. TaxID=1885344 RepID=UPI003B526BD9